MDIFPTDSENPIRIEFFGDTIDEIKVFDVNTQLTIRKIDEIEINPNTEFLTEDNVDSFDKKYYELPNYTNVVNISKYFDNIITIYDDLDKIKQSYELLTDEILNYNKSIDGDPNRKYMFNLEEINLGDFTYLSNSRQISLVKKAVEISKNLEDALNNDVPIDLLEIDIKEICEILGEIIGESYDDKLIDTLFSNFCLGK